MSKRPGVLLFGRAKPSASLQRKVHQVYGKQGEKDLNQMMDDMVALDALTKLLEQGMQQCRNPTTGLMDTKDLAVFLLRFMKGNQKL
jgi:hypothetical protein